MRYVGGGAEIEIGGGAEGQQFTRKAKERETKEWAGGGSTRHLCSSQQSVVNRYITYIRVYVAYIRICNISTLWTNNAYQCYFLTLPVLPDPPA